MGAGTQSAEQQDKPRHAGQQKEHRKAQNHLPPATFAPGGFQTAIPSPMAPNMDHDEPGKEQRNDGMYRRPPMPCGGITGMPGGMEFEPGPKYPSEKRQQSPVDPEIECAFVHFNEIFQTLQSNRLSGTGKMDEPGECLDYPRYRRRKAEGLIPASRVKSREK